MPATRGMGNVYSTFLKKKLLALIMLKTTEVLTAENGPLSAHQLELVSGRRAKET
jgi:hypothetical protein